MKVSCPVGAVGDDRVAARLLMRSALLGRDGRALGAGREGALGQQHLVVALLGLVQVEVELGHQQRLGVLVALGELAG